MTTNKIRKIFNRLGIDIHRYRKESNRLTWILSLNINSVFDVGANIGQFAKEIRGYLPNAHIYSFEPLKDCFDKLSMAFKNDNKFTAFNYALGEKEAEVIMNKSSYSPSSSLLKMADSHKKLFPHSKDHVAETIKVIKLDDVLAKINPKKEIMIKVDTQGYEAMVIAGGNHAFGVAKVVLIETSFVKLYENQPLFDDIYNKLKTFGFSYQGALHQKINPKTGEVIFEDSIFLKLPL